jgi:monoterpene epsilon-lactone hydrolase
MSQQEMDQVRAFLAQSPADRSWAEMREMYDSLGAIFPTPDDVVHEQLDVAGVPAEWADPPGAAADRAILYLHGGGYVIGSIASHRHLVAAVARRRSTHFRPPSRTP